MGHKCCHQFSRYGYHHQEIRGDEAEGRCKYATEKTPACLRVYPGWANAQSDQTDSYNYKHTNWLYIVLM